MTAAASPHPDRRRQVIRQALSVALATGTYGISFGALGVASGLTVLQTVLLSVLLFSGGSQFALAGVLGAGGTGGAAVATSTLLGVRNGLYALQVSRLLEARGWRRLLAAHLTIDESTAVAVGQPEREMSRLGFWITGGGVFIGWNLTTLAGALIGSQLGDPETYGLDAAAVAAFCALLWPRLGETTTRLVAVAAAGIALVLSPVTAAGVPVLAAAAAAFVVGAVPRRRTPATPTEEATS